jgi:hypothetical protein
MLDRLKVGHWRSQLRLPWRTGAIVVAWSLRRPARATPSPRVAGAPPRRAADLGSRPIAVEAVEFGHRCGGREEPLAIDQQRARRATPRGRAVVAARRRALVQRVPVGGEEISPLLRWYK